MRSTNLVQKKKINIINTNIVEYIIKRLINEIIKNIYKAMMI